MRITKRIWFGGLAFLAAVTAAGTPAMAQQTTGTPGSPGATTTIDGRYLPAPPPKLRRDEPQRPRVEALVAAARGPSQAHTLAS